MQGVKGSLGTYPGLHEWDNTDLELEFRFLSSGPSYQAASKNEEGLGKFKKVLSI